jgi:hypothetical protein
MAILPGNPYQTSAKLGSFRRYTDGVFQGMADADAAVQNFLNQGQISPTATLPLWGGLPIAETVFQGNLGANKPTLTAATTNAGITGFSVFDQGHHGVITPGPNNVPLFYPGMDLPFYRLGSGARIPVQASSALVSLVNGSIFPTVTWNFTTGELVPTTAGTAVTVSSIAVTGTAYPYTALVTTAAAHGLNVGDTVTLAGFTPSGYNGTTYEVQAANFTTNTFTILLTTNPGAVTTAGTVAVTAGTGTLSVKVLSFHSNARIVFNDPVSGNVYWNDGTAAIIQL